MKPFLMFPSLKPQSFFHSSLCLLVLATLTGCDLKFGKKKGSVADAPQAEATKIVEYTNDIIDVTSKYNNAAESAVTYYGDLTEHINGTRSYMPSYPGSMSTLWTEKKAEGNAFGEPSESLGNDRQFFKDSVGLYARLFKTFKEQDSTLAIYVKAEDYKDDKFEKGAALINKQYAIYPQLVRLRSSIIEKVTTVADAAEEISLKDSPIRDAYKAAKGDLAKFKALANRLVEKETFTDADLATIDTKYSELTASLEKNKNADKSKLDKVNKTYTYELFYKTSTEQAAELKTVIRAIKETKTLTKDEFDRVDNIFNQVVYAYNSWVS